jgi:AraC family transcriptional regulator
VETIEAQLQGSDARLQLLRANWPRPVTVVSHQPEHCLLLYLPPSGFKGEGRFPEFRKGPYRPISSVFFRPADVSLEAHGTGGSTRAIRYWFTRERLTSILEREDNWTARELEAGLDLDRSLLRPVLLRLMQETLCPGFASAALVDALGVTAMVELARRLAGGNEPRAERGHLRTAQIAVIRERCAAPELPPPSVAELAQLAGVSERSLLRLFKKTTGETVGGFLCRSRIDAARALLGNTNFALKEVAYRLGFASHSSFAAAFHREVGITPLEFRRDQRRQYPSG